LENICPVCETQNAARAEHCEVCGERLSPLEPGEVLAPEENVAAMLAAETPSVDEHLPLENQVFDQEEFPAAALEAVSSAIEEDEGNPAQVLYSPLDGKAYFPGSPEYDEGFGPMGESLTAAEPELGNTASDLVTTYVPDYEEGMEAPSQVQVSEVQEDLNEGAAPEDSYIDAAGISGSPQFREMFKSEPKIREKLAPLPQPGTYVNPATLTLYVNREEAHKHYIENDETLLGRRDPHSDAYPDFDLSEYDTKGLVSRKHAYVYRQNKNYTLYVVSNAGTQLNNELLSLGDRRVLKPNDVIVLAGVLAIKFEIASS